MSRSIIYIFFLFFPVYTFAQVTWKLNAEAGYFKTTGEDLILQDDILTRLNGQVKLNYLAAPHDASLVLNVQPEYLGAKNKTGILKIKATGNYFNYSDNLSWGLNFDVIKNNYFGDVLEVKYDIFSFQSSLMTTFLEKPLNTILGYTFQNVDYTGSITYDLIYNETEYLFVNDRYFTSGMGLYTEKFIVENEYSFYPANKMKNEGWRTGPLVNIHYLKDFLLTFSYRVLLHFANSVESPSYEHQITLVAGKVFFEKYSLFALADFYIRDFKLSQEIPGRDLIYSPVNQENKYSLKFAYELNDNAEIFLRSGYSEENVDYIANNLAGWSFTLGFELR